MPEQKTLLIMALRSLFVGSQFVAADEAAEVPETEARELIRNGWAVETEQEETDPGKPKRGGKRKDATQQPPVAPPAPPSGEGEGNSETPPPAGGGEQQPNGESNPSANSDNGEQPPVGSGEPNV